MMKMTNQTAMQVMKRLHREANPAAKTRGTPRVEALRLGRSRKLALANAAAALHRVNIAATAESAATVQRLTDEAQCLLDAAAGFLELIDDIPNGRLLAA